MRPLAPRSKCSLNPPYGCHRGPMTSHSGLHALHPNSPRKAPAACAGSWHADMHEASGRTYLDSTSKIAGCAASAYLPGYVYPMTTQRHKHIQPVPVGSVMENLLRLTQESQLQWARDADGDYAVNYQGISIAIRTRFGDQIVMIWHERSWKKIAGRRASKPLRKAVLAYMATAVSFNHVMEKLSS